MTYRYEFKDRLRQLIADQKAKSEKKLNQHHIGAQFKVKGPMISDYLSGKKLPSMKTFIRIAVFYNVCVEWLVTGRGPKYPETSWPEAVQEIADLWPKLPQNIQVTMLTLAQTAVDPLPNAVDQKGHPVDPRMKSQKTPH